MDTCSDDEFDSVALFFQSFRQQRYLINHENNESIEASPPNAFEMKNSENENVLTSDCDIKNLLNLMLDQDDEQVSGVVVRQNNDQLSGVVVQQNNNQLSDVVMQQNNNQLSGAVVRQNNEHDSHVVARKRSRERSSHEKLPLRKKHHKNFNNPLQRSSETHKTTSHHSRDHAHRSCDGDVSRQRSREKRRDSRDVVNSRRASRDSRDYRDKGRLSHDSHDVVRRTPTQTSSRRSSRRPSRDSHNNLKHYSLNHRPRSRSRSRHERSTSRYSLYR